jgi:membrane protease YdiL (CAAX protease family)
MLHTRIQSLTYSHPILTGVFLVLAAMVFRLADIFILELDERLGEIILSKTLGFLLVLFFVSRLGRNLSAIGFHTRKLAGAVWVGTLATAIPFLIGYAVEWLLAAQAGQKPGLVFAAIDPKAGVSGGLMFAAWLVLGNVVNAFMEEGLFRGVLINLNRLKFRPASANAWQAVLFGAWHLVWVPRWIQTGTVTTPGEIGFAIVANFLPQLLLGLVWGVMYLHTGSLWSAWAAHFLTNTTLNLLHVQTHAGLDSGMAVRLGVFSLASLSMIILIRWFSRRLQLPLLPTWVTNQQPEAAEARR